MKQHIITNIIALLFITILISACDKERIIKSDYVGDWVEKRDINHILSINIYNSFSEKYKKTELYGDQYITTIDVYKGDVLVDGDSIYFILNRVSIQEYNPVDSSYGGYGFIREEDEFYENYGDGITSYHYEVSDNQLTLARLVDGVWDIQVFKKLY